MKLKNIYSLEEKLWQPSQSVSSVAQSCPNLHPMNHSMPGLPVHLQVPESTQTHVHRVDNAIQLSHPLSSPSLPALNLSQHQGLFNWVRSLHQVVKGLELQLQHQSFQWIFRTVSFRMDWLDLLIVQGTLKSLLQHHFRNTEMGKKEIQKRSQACGLLPKGEVALLIIEINNLDRRDSAQPLNERQKWQKK